VQSPPNGFYSPRSAPREVTSAHNFMDNNWSLAVVQAQLIQSVQSLLLDLILEDPLSIDDMSVIGKLILGFGL
jgi:hypothetical protein